MLDFATTFRPKTSSDVLEAVRAAVRDQQPIEILGHGSRRGIGHPVETPCSLDLSELSGITFYEPDELVLSARAGTPLAEIEQALAAENQELAFEPMDHGPLFGAPAGRGTIGGVLAANVSGPRRLKAGGARDHVLGIEAVSGRGEGFKSGGRVVKNVTGYDLSKGLAGSWGTLAVLTDINFKVLPRAETSATLAIAGLGDEAAIALLCKAMGSSGEVSGAAHIPETLVGALPVPALAASGQAVTLLRLEGFRPSVLYRAERLAGMLAGAGEMARIEEADSLRLWRAIRDVEFFAGNTNPLWKVSVAPKAGAAIVAALAASASFRHAYDWSGGLVWIEMAESTPDASATTLRAAVAAAGGGHATLIRGAGVDPAVPRFEPQPTALAILSRRLKESFDPLDLLNPGRMVRR